jgi:hypothetical protein
MGEPMTQYRLYNYIKLKGEVEDYLERVARMKSAERFAPKGESTGSQRQPGASDRMTDAIIRRMNYEENWLPLINKNLDEMAAIEQAVAALDDPLERAVLRRRYMEPSEESAYRHPTWSCVALQIYHSDEDKYLLAVKRLHKRALLNLCRETN